MSELFEQVIPHWWHLYMTSATTFAFSTGITIYVVVGVLWITGRIGK